MPLFGTLGTLSDKSFGFTAVSAKPPGAPTIGTATTIAPPTATVTTTYDIPYGANFLQRVDLLVPDGVIKGVVMHIHGGGWTGGSKSASGFTPSQAAYTNNDDAEVQQVAQAGYVVINCNYRLVSQAAYGYGGDGTGGYPNAINDIQTILQYCMVSGAGAGQSTYWNTIYNYVSTYGLMVTGTSAGGHLAVMGVGNYGTSSGNWPRAVGDCCGPMDLVFNGAENPEAVPQQQLVNAFAVPSDPTGNTVNIANLKASSPRYQYLYDGVQGPWYTALNASSCKFYFIQNNNDTLVNNTQVLPFINSLPVSKHNLELVTEGTPTAGVYDHNYTTTLHAHILDFANHTFSPTAVGDAAVTYTAPALDGGTSIIYYQATAYLLGVSTGITGRVYTPSSGTVNVLGLALNTTYTFKVLAHNSAYDGPLSGFSNSTTTYNTPGAPTIGSVTYTNGPSASVAFTAPGSTGGSPIIEYTVLGFVSGVQVAVYKISTASPATVNGLIGGQSYTFKVYATTAVGNSATSNATSPAIAVITAPIQPTSVSATNTSVATSSVATANITFTIPASTGGSAITSYTVTAYTASNDTTTGLTASGTPSGATFSGLTKGVAYIFRVTATNTVGTSIYSAPSSSITLTTVPDKPVIGTIYATSGVSMMVPFTAPTDNGGSPITRYTAVSSPGNITAYINQSGSGSIPVSGLTKGTPYTFVVYATNSIGNSANSNSSNSVTPADTPSAPIITSVTTPTTNTGTTSSVTITYTASSDNGGATITSYTAVSSPGSLTASVNTALGGTITVTGLTKGTAYTFVVYATNRVGNSSNSVASDSITPRTVPSIPIIGTATPTGTTSVSVAFTSSTDNGGVSIALIYTATAYNEPAATKTLLVSSSTTSPASVSGLTQGAQYAFTVYATNQVGNTSESSLSNIVYTWDVPGTPTVGTPTFSTAYVSTTTSVTVPLTSAVINTNIANLTYGAEAYLNSDSSDTNLGGTTINSPQTVAATSNQSSSVTVNGLTKGTAYKFKVYSVNTVGTSTYSSFSTAVTPVTVPNAPTIGTPTTSNIYTSDGRVAVYFTAPTDSGGLTVNQYYVISSPGSLTNTGSASPITVSGLTKGTPYTFQVRASNTSGSTYGSYSLSSSSITPITRPTAPTSASATPTSGTTATIVVGIPSDNGGRSITSYYATTAFSNIAGGPYSDASLNFSSSTTTIPITGLTNGKYYVFTVYATNSIPADGATIYGSSVGSNEINPADVPSSPTITNITQYPSYTADGRVNVTVSTPYNGGATIDLYTVSDGQGHSGTRSSATGGTITVTGLTKGVSYTFTATAHNRIGYSGSSGSYSFTPLSVPGTPTLGTPSYSASPGVSTASVSILVSTTDNGGSTITSYSAISSPGGFTGSLNASSGTITITGLNKGTAYTFNVTATNAQGTGSPATSSSVTSTSAPTAPTSVTATKTLDSTTASLSWTAPSDTGGTGVTITSYTITDNHGVQTTSSTTSQYFSSLTSAYTYYWTVTATNSVGSTGAAGTSNIISLPAYYVGVSPTSVDETNNTYVAIALATSNVPDGSTIYWTTTGTATAPDFVDGVSSGSVTISSGTALVARYILADHLTEGTETFQIQFRINSTSGTVEATSSVVSIADTSLTYGVITFSSASNTVNVPKSSISSYTSSGSFVVTMSSGTVGTVTIGYSGNGSTVITPSSFTFTYVGQTQTVSYTVTTPVGVSAETSYLTIFAGAISTGSGLANPNHTLTQNRIAYTESITVSPTSGYTNTSFTYTVTGAPGTSFYYWNSSAGVGTQYFRTLGGFQGDASAGSTTVSGVNWTNPGTFGVFVHWLTTGDGDSSGGYSAGYATSTYVAVTVVYPPLVVSASPSTSMSGQVGQPFTGSQSAATGTASVSATGGSGSGYTYFVSGGSLPGGVGLTTGGLFTGTPTTSNFYSITVTAQDGVGTTGTINISIVTVAAPALTITGGNGANITSGQIETLTWTSTGTSGVYIIANGIDEGTYGSNSNFVIIYSVSSATSYSGTITPIAVNGIQVSGSAQSWSWTVYPAPTITFGATTTAYPYNSSTASSLSVKGGTSAYYNWTSTNAVSVVYYISTNGSGFTGPNSLGLQGPSGALVLGDVTITASTYFTLYLVATNGAGTTATSQQSTITWTPYNEILSNSPTSITYPGTNTLTVTGGLPNDTFTWSVNATTYDQPAISLDSSGNYTTTTAWSGVGPGTYTFYAKFTTTTHTRQAQTVTISNPAAPVVQIWSISPASGTTQTFTVTFYATGTNLSSMTIYLGGPASGSYPVTVSGSYTYSSFIFTSVGASTTPWSAYFTITDSYGQTTTSSTIYHTEYFASGTYQGQFCSGYNLYYIYADGSGGTYNSLVQSNSPSCGYVPPNATIFITAYGDTSNITVAWSTSNASSTSWSNYITSTAASGSQYFNGAGGAFTGGSFSLTGTAYCNTGGNNASKTINIGPIYGSFYQSV